ncbi:serine kinase [bacterium]|nr:MAG: serine kinase [bacterium]
MFLVASSESNQALNFLERLESIFEQATQESEEVIERFYRIGGHSVRLQFAGQFLVKGITPALEHLRSEPTATPDVTIGIWDGESTATELPPLFWEQAGYRPDGGIHGSSDIRVQLHMEPTLSLLSVLDVSANRGYFRIPAALALPLYQSGSPLLRILHWWMAHQGVNLVHGGAVGTPEGGVLLIGKGGMGKSTAALCCLNSELSYGSDDYSLVGINPTPHFYSLYNSGKVNSTDVGKHAFMSTAQRDGLLDNQKALYFLYSHFPHKIIRDFPLRALVVPHVTGQPDSHVRPTTSGKALLALAPSTIFQLPGAEIETMSRLSGLAKMLPAYVLESGTDLSQIPKVLTELVMELNRQARI